MLKLSFLNKEHTIAGPGFNRWLVPPAALAIHLSIGMAYGFSVFWLPLSKAIGITAPVACPAEMGFLEKVFTTSCDWPISMLGWMFTLFFVFLGSSAAILGGWVEKAGPRKAAAVAAVCWAGGLLISAVGVYLHQIWLMWLGSGAIGGIGLGLGYLSPVPTLIKWFPDKRGMATGLAIMGFGGGAMVGVPLADRLMNFFATSSDVGVWQTFLVLAAIYLLFMLAGAFGYRIPAPGWKPAGWTAPTKSNKNAMVSTRDVSPQQAIRTPQFWLVWGVLCLNVTAGIGLLGMASPLIQEIFGGRLIGISAAFGELDAAQRTQIAAIAAGFIGLVSLFNIAGRFIWASFSDVIGRKPTYTIFFVLGIVLYALLPTLGSSFNLVLYVLAFGVIISMYGGGFATLPAYLADLFGPRNIGAIQGRMLTAWATAGVLGPVLVNYIREYQIAAGVEPAQVYDVTMYILAGLLAIGLVCNLLVRPVAEKFFLKDDAASREEKSTAAEKGDAGNRVDKEKAAGPASLVGVAAAWAAVGIPLAFGLWNTIQQAVVLFK